MNKTEFIKAIAEQAGISAKDAAKAVDAFAEVIATTLKGGDKVALVGFGSFELKRKAARNGFDPRTRRAITIKAADLPICRFGKTYKARFN